MHKRRSDEGKCGRGSGAAEGDGGVGWLGGSAGGGLGDGGGEGGEPFGLAVEEGGGNEREFLAECGLENEPGFLGEVEFDGRDFGQGDAEDDFSGEEGANEPDERAVGEIFAERGGDEALVGEEGGALGDFELSGEEILDSGLADGVVEIALELDGFAGQLFKFGGGERRGSVVDGG